MPDDTTETKAATPAPAAPAATPAAAPVAGPPVTTVQPVAVPTEQAVTLVRGDVPAQVMGDPRPGLTTKPVHETYYKSDQVITDTSDPLAVQPGPQEAPDANHGKTAEQQFAEAAGQ